MKDGFFQLRISKQDRAALDELAEYYNLSASAVLCMLISQDIRKIKKEKNNGDLCILAQR